MLLRNCAKIACADAVTVEVDLKCVNALSEEENVIRLLIKVAKFV